MKNYIICDYDGTGMLEVQSLNTAIMDDDQATAEAIKDGIKIIPVEELPENFDRRYLGWIDSPENRQLIKEYVEGDTDK